MNQYQDKIIELRQKAWYRFVQVLYLLALLLILLVVVPWTYSDNRPRQELDYGKETIRCNNGETFLKESRLDLDIRRICAGAVHEVESPDGKIIQRKSIPGPDPGYTNYTEQEIYINVGSWSAVLKWMAISIGITLAFFEVVRRAFLYIVARINPFYMPSWMK